MRLTMMIAAAVSLPLSVAAQEVSEETVTQINELLAGMNCQMDPSDIEVEDGGYELDDVMCEDGQYDIELDGNLRETGRRKE
jgi:hypothetical protein